MSVWLSQSLKKLKTWQLVALAVMVAEVITALASISLMFVLWHWVSPDILLIGAADALAASLAASFVLIYLVKYALDLQAINQGLQFEIAERQRIQAALQQSEERWRTYIDEASDLIFGLNPSGHLVLANRTTCQTLGYELAELLGRNPLDFVPAESQAKVRQALGNILGGTPVDHLEIQVLTRTGQLVWLEVRGRTFYENNVVLGTFHIARDITERRQSAMRLEYLSTHDVLTDLYNRAFFEEELKRLEHSRYLPVSIMMCDVNGLKTTNDRQGHVAGDELLRRAANVLREAFRAEDIVARIGGDEFVALLPNTDGANATQILTRVRERLVKYNEGAPAQLSLALGVATATESGTLLQVLQQADAQMYRDKHGE